MSEYLNKNGLVQGLIPANTACPFLSKCKFKVHTCPGVDGKMKSGNFSCAAARLHSAIAENGNHPEDLAKAKDIVEAEPPMLFQIRKLPTHITFSGMKAVKDPNK